MPRFAPLVLLALLSGYLLARALSFWPYTVDDAFISLRYAQNLVEHGQLVWNEGEFVEGISNPLWTLWLALGLSTGVAIVPWLKISGLACGVALVPATYLLGKRTTASAAVGLIAAAIVATNASVALWSVAGLETTSFALLLVLFALRLEVELDRRADGGSALPISAVLFSLAWMSRPEAPAYGLYLVVRRLFAGKRPAFGRPDVAWLVVAAVLVGGYEIFGLAYFGGLLPATHSAKVGGGSPFVEALRSLKFDRFLGTRFVLSQGPLFASFWLVSGFAALVVLRRIPAAAWAMGAGGLVFIAYAFTDWMPRYRFFVPPLPFLALAHAVGLAWVAERIAVQSKALGWAVVIAIVGGGALDQAQRGYDRQHNVALAVSPRGAWPLELGERITTPWEPGRQELDAWYILRETPQHEWIACPDIGFMGAFARNPIWDIRGLVTPNAAAFLPLREEDPAFVETRRAMLDEMFALQPALILLPTRPQGMAPVARRFMEALESDPRTAQRYDRIPPFMEARVVWRRKSGWEAVDVDQRTREGLDRLPSYGTAMKDAFAPK